MQSAEKCAALKGLIKIRMLRALPKLLLFSDIRPCHPALSCVISYEKESGRRRKEGRVSYDLIEESIIAALQDPVMDEV